jgi:hypothetical protein
MFKVGDIVELVNVSIVNGSSIGDYKMDIGNLFIVKGVVNYATANFLEVRSTSHRTGAIYPNVPFLEVRFRLLARKTEFGYIIV